MKYGWNEECAVKSERYVLGAIADHEHEKREIWDELRDMLRSQPDTPEDALQRWGEWLLWKKEKSRQCLEDNSVGIMKIQLGAHVENISKQIRSPSDAVTYCPQKLVW